MQKVKEKDRKITLQLTKEALLHGDSANLMAYQWTLSSQILPTKLA